MPWPIPAAPAHRIASARLTLSTAASTSAYPVNAWMAPARHRQAACRAAASVTLSVARCAFRAQVIGSVDTIPHIRAATFVQPANACHARPRVDAILDFSAIPLRTPVTRVQPTSSAGTTLPMASDTSASRVLALSALAMTLPPTARVTGFAEPRRPIPAACARAILSARTINSTGSTPYARRLGAA